MSSFQFNNVTIPCDTPDTPSPNLLQLRNNGTFRWDEKKDKLLLREVRIKQPYLYKTGTKDSGQKWTEIATALNAHQDFAIQPRDQRSVREHFNKIFGEFKAKMRSEEKESGISPDELTETEKLLEEIHEIILSNESSPSPAVGKESERDKALSVRKKAMETWGKKEAKDEDNDDQEDCKVVKTRKRTRRSSTDPMEYLKMKKETEIEMKKEEMAFMKEKVALEEKKLELEGKRQAQMQEQLLLQQRQMQQQMEAQTQSQSLILAMLQKMNK